jgi:hypothetical protein
MAPEQVLGDEVDGRADLYAVGLILYRLLAGTLPFDADTPMAMLQKQVAEAPPPLQKYRQDLPDWCDIVAQRALAKAPADRFQTAEEFRAAVGRAIGLTPALDLAKAFAVSATDVSADATESEAIETLAISRSEAGLPPLTPAPGSGSILERAAAQVPIAPAHVAAMLLRTRDFVTRWKRVAVVAGLCAAGAVAYLIANASATNAGTTRRSETRTADRTPSPIDKRETEPRSTQPARSAAGNESATAARSEARGTRGTTTPLVFRAKLVSREGRERREEEARLTFARERFTVTANDDPDEPAFSAPYRNITAIEHSREPGWKPPKKWSRHIKLGDDVLQSIGIRDRHEISVQTGSDLVVLRLDDQIVNTVLRTLKERTGLTPELAAAR